MLLQGRASAAILARKVSHAGYSVTKSGLKWSGGVRAQKTSRSRCGDLAGLLFAQSDLGKSGAVKREDSRVAATAEAVSPLFNGHGLGAPVGRSTDSVGAPMRAIPRINAGKWLTAFFQDRVHVIAHLDDLGASSPRVICKANSLQKQAY